MKVFVILLFFSCLTRADNLDFSLKGNLPKNGQIVFGYDLIPLADWLKRPSSDALFLRDCRGKSDLEVFEARGAAIISKPVSFFTENYLQNLETVKKLDPNDSHVSIPHDKQFEPKDCRDVALAKTSFGVETTLQFPPDWSRYVAIAKKAFILTEEKTDYLQLTGFFEYKSGAQITEDPKFMNYVQELDIVGRPPDVASKERIVKINQIAQFGTVFTFFYALDGNRTLIVNYFALALKEKDLNRGIDAFGIQLNGRSLLLGQNSAEELTTNTGIGAGLPNYSKELFQNMVRGLNH